MGSLVEELEVAWRDGVAHGLCLAWCKTYLLKALQLLHRTVNAALHVADIELYHFLSLALASIGHCHRNGVASNRRLAIFECCVAQAIAKREARLHLSCVEMTIAHIDSFLVIHLVVNTRIAFLTILEARIVLHLLGECYRQFAAWVHLSGDNVGERLS